MKKRFAFTITPVESPERNPHENEEVVWVTPIHPEANEEMQGSRLLKRRGPAIALVTVPPLFQERVERPAVSMSRVEPSMRRIPELPPQARVPERARAFRPPLMLIPVAPPRYGKLNREMGVMAQRIFRMIGL